MNNADIIINTTHPKTPSCTCPGIQSVKCAIAFTDLID